ncbi:MAG: murein transglycosylase [Alphaproteobacteria bacterium]|nr:murein transglycosylase [Alphaproteobacteria bacterium]
MHFAFRRVAALSLLFLSTACSFMGESDRFGAREVTFDQLEGWHQDDHLAALKTFNISCPVLARKPRDAKGSDIEISKATWRSLCADGEKAALSGNSATARQFFEKRFTPFRINNNGKEKGLFTGYYEPMLYGSRHKTKAFKYPVYALPADIKKPYYTHAQIQKGALKNRGLELAWVDDPVMLFFMQIQGSGRIRLNDDSVMHVGYAGQNGYEYQSLGKIMGDENLLPKDKINFFTIRQWLYDNPTKAIELMSRNPSYVFFKAMDREGAVGAVGVVLTPRRSIAIDSKYIPYGLPVFMETTLPASQTAPESEFNRTMVAQDTGGAIRGPVRADIFFGVGETAEYMAGYMKGRGTYNLLVPKEAASQLK